MSIEMLKRNIREERMLLSRLEWLYTRRYFVKNARDNMLLDKAINSAKNQIRILNNSVPALVNNISLIRRLPREPQYFPLQKNKEIENIETKSELISVNHRLGSSTNLVAINKSEKTEYLRQLHLLESSLKDIKKRKVADIEIKEEFKKPNPYISISNKLFSKISAKFIDGGHFVNLGNSLRKGNFMILLNSYISMVFFTTFLALIFGIIITLFFIFFGISLESPYIYPNPEIAPRILQTFWIIPLLPLLTFLIVYFYPHAEKSSIERSIDYELPFVTIQMAAIAGSDIEPSNIFKIIALSKEYPHVRREAKKLMNQINLYGYDLVNALRNVAAASPSKSWAELLNGLSTTIRSGGDLSKYFQKRAETLLFEYKLKREKATKSAETFMNIYISVVVAAPMLMMLLLIMINISGIGFDLPMWVITIIIVSVVALINVIFLVFLHLSQQKL